MTTKQRAARSRKVKAIDPADREVAEQLSAILTYIDAAVGYALAAEGQAYRRGTQHYIRGARAHFEAARDALDRADRLVRDAKRLLDPDHQVPWYRLPDVRLPVGQAVLAEADN